jgi:N4-gp56 family major capsid protein
MAIQTVSTLSNAVRTAYAAKYLEAAEMERMYDRFAQPVGQLGVEKAAKLDSTVRVNFLGDMIPGTTAISESSDVVPSVLKDAYAEVTPTSRWGALQWSELMDLEAYTNYGESRFKAIGKNMMETVDLLAQAACLQGGNLFRVAATRVALDAGTAGHRLTDSVFSQVDVRLQALKTPAYLGNGRRQYIALMHPYAYADLRLGGNVVTIAQYQAKEIILNQELGSVGNFKIVASPWAKVFWSAGAVNASSVATTIATTAVNPLDKTITVAADTNITVGMQLSIGTVETANTHYATNERITITDLTATPVLSCAGEGANGGFRFPHAIGETVKNADSVFPVVFGGPESIVKLYDEGTGEYGEIVGPKKDGLLDQFGSLGWKWYGNYGRVVESWILRGEFASVLEA